MAGDIEKRLCSSDDLQCTQYFQRFTLGISKDSGLNRVPREGPPTWHSVSFESCVGGGGRAYQNDGFGWLADTVLLTHRDVEVHVRVDVHRDFVTGCECYMLLQRRHVVSVRFQETVYRKAPKFKSTRSLIKCSNPELEKLLDP